jgi:hypothetical protein
VDIGQPLELFELFLSHIWQVGDIKVYLPRFELLGILPKSLKWKHLVTGRDIPDFVVIMNEGAELSFLANTFLFSEFLAHVSLVLLRMIETLESSVGELAVHGAASSLLGVVILTFLRLVEVSVRRSAVVEWFVLVDAKIPIVVLRFVGAGCGFVPVHIE